MSTTRDSSSSSAKSSGETLRFNVVSKSVWMGTCKAGSAYDCGSNSHNKRPRRERNDDKRVPIMEWRGKVERVDEETSRRHASCAFTSFGAKILPKRSRGALETSDERQRLRASFA